MLSTKQRNECTALQDKKSELSEEYSFAQNGVFPWKKANWTESTRTGQCDQHGEYLERILTGPEFNGRCPTKTSLCPACVQAELDDIDARLHALRIEDLLDDAGIARRFEDCEFANYHAVNDAAARNLAACQRYADTWKERFELGTGLVMTGNCGTGKNHLAISLVKAIIRKHLARVEITDVMRLTRAVKNTWRHNSELSEDEVIYRFASLDLLIIDEVGVQFGTPTEATILQEIINARYESVLPTILISNLTFDQLKEAIGERIVDRVTDGGRNRLAFGWSSYRATSGGVSA